MCGGEVIGDTAGVTWADGGAGLDVRAGDAKLVCIWGFGVESVGEPSTEADGIVGDGEGLKVSGAVATAEGPGEGVTGGVVVVKKRGR